MGLALPQQVFSANQEDLARKFVRCGFVLTKLAESIPDKQQADSARAAATMFIAIGAVKATNREFVEAELVAISDSFAREMKILSDADRSPAALKSFLIKKTLAVAPCMQKTRRPISRAIGQDLPSTVVAYFTPKRTLRHHRGRRRHRGQPHRRS
jgi:hypothetical protein